MLLLLLTILSSSCRMRTASAGSLLPLDMPGLLLCGAVHTHTHQLPVSAGLGPVSERQDYFQWSCNVVRCERERPAGVAG